MLCNLFSNSLLPLWLYSQIILKDRLSFYRFQKKPTHSRGYHFIPSNLLNLEKSTVDGKERLSRLSETAFQELCADVYDEVMFEVYFNGFRIF